MTTLVLAHGGAWGLALESGLLALPIAGLLVLWARERRQEQADERGDAEDSV